MTIPEVADLIGGGGGVCDEFAPPLKQRQMGPFDTENLEDVDDLPVCCICGFA